MTAIAKLARLTRSRQDWAEAITATWQRAVTHAVQVVILTGREIADAKKALKHGEFLEMVENDLPFSRQTAHKLMKVADDARLSNVAHVRHLPPTWGTLYELTKVSDDQLEQGFETGVIHPAMERKDVAALRGKARKPRRKAKTAKLSETLISAVDRCAMDVRTRIFDALRDMNDEERLALIERLRGEIDDLVSKNQEGALWT